MVKFILFFLLLISCENRKQIKEDSVINIAKEEKENKELQTFLNLKNKDTIREKFDFELFEKVKKVSEGVYVKPNGDMVVSMNWYEGGDASDKFLGGYIREIIGKPPYITVLKEFYIDGYIKEKKTFLGQYLPIGISEYYDKYGKLTQVNEENRYGKIKPADVLKFIEKQGVINLKTGKGFFVGDPLNAELSFNISYGKPQDATTENDYYIIGLKYKGGEAETDPSGGEPPSASDLIYYMNSKTGRVYTQKEFLSKEEKN
jgi:hypothetical protein